MVDCEQNHRFDELRLHNRSLDCYDRLTGKDGSSFGNAVYVAFEFKILEIVEEFLAEAPASEIFNILIRKAQIFEIFNELSVSV